MELSSVLQPKFITFSKKKINISKDETILERLSKCRFYFISKNIFLQQCKNVLSPTKYAEKHH